MYMYMYDLKTLLCLIWHEFIYSVSILQIKVGPGASIYGAVAYIFVFLIMEYPYLQRPKLELLAMSGVIGLCFVMGILFPFLDNYAQLGGLVFGFFLSWIVVQYKYIDKDTINLYAKHPITTGQLNELCNKQHRTFILKYVMMGISSVASLILFVVCLLWLYVGQGNWYDFTYLSCIPYTATFCLSYGQSLESRNYY